MSSLKVLAIFLIVFATVNVGSTDSDVWDSDSDSDDIFVRRQMATAFNNMVKRKHDAEEVREIEHRAQGQRIKAYKYYEDNCKANDKLKIRACPKLRLCFARNNLRYVPAQPSYGYPIPPIAPKPTTKKPSRWGREFIEKTLAMRFLDDDASENYDDVDKRLFKSEQAEKSEEFKETRDKAFKGYEEYCEKNLVKRLFQRSCPALDKKKCENF